MPARTGKGTALVEFCLILPILLVLGFAIIDFGLLIQARLVVTNIAREGGELAARMSAPTTASENSLITMLQSSANPPLNLSASGEICVTNIVPGTAANPDPAISSTLPQVCVGGIEAQSGVTGSSLGLTQAVYNLLVYNTQNKAPDISTGVTVVEVFYEYKPITPLPQLIPGIFSNNSGTIISSRAVFCTVGN